MAGAGRDAPPPPSNNGGEFLLSLLQRPQQRQLSQQQQQQQVISMDPAVAAVGPPSASYLPWADGLAWGNNNNNNNNNLAAAAAAATSNNSPIGTQWSFPINNNENNSSQQNRWFSGIDNIRAHTRVYNDNNHHNHVNHMPSHQQHQHQQHMLQFGQFGDAVTNNFETNRRFVNGNYEHDNARGKQQQQQQQQQQYIGNYRSAAQSSETRVLPRLPPPGFSRQSEENNININNNMGRSLLSEDVNLQQRFEQSVQIDKPSLPVLRKNMHSMTSVRDIQESLLNSHLDEENDDGDNVESFGRQIVDSLLEGEADGKIEKRNHRDKDMRSDNRGQQLLSYGMRLKNSKRPYRRDIFRLNPPLLAIYKSLIPSEEEKAKQVRLFTRLEKLVAKEWPEARLYLYGSCASTFGVLKSDIDVCLSFRGQDVNKSEVLLKLADILQSDNLQNVQALTRARVPIVKLMDPETGISCDICINNLLAVINTKLLRDYAQIDGRLRQLAFIVKHWAKTRGVNETYQGTLSSYAYVLMCIHFLQQRRPAILPCLQMMEPTFTEIVDDTGCAFFDRVERLSNYGSQNLETIAELLWGFFTYWAYRHDYTRDVISVRTGGIINKRDKDWTRRIGNDRHLICIEDPFEITHDLGRVVDKFSIKVLREEFERAAEILQFDPNPCVTLFEPYVPTC